MHDLAETVPTDHPDVRTGTDGEFKGWQLYTADNFEALIGPFWYRDEPDGNMRCAFRVQPKHLNASGYVHGGCLLAFADSCLYVIAKPAMSGRGVTTHLSGDFINAAERGDLIEGTGEITRAGGLLVFVRGQLTSGSRTLFTFSGTIRRMGRSSAILPGA